MEKYQRAAPERTGEKPKHRGNRRFREGMKKLDTNYREAVQAAADTEMLLTEEAGFLEAEGMEKTYKFRQQDIAKAVDTQTANKKFDFKLNEFGPYTLDFSRTGRDLLIGGRKGHVALMDWRKGVLGCELHLGETVFDVKWLHNNQYFAAAQKKYSFIYNQDGIEVHRLKHLVEMTHLDFLPYHFLLAASGKQGWLKYTDTLTGQLVAEHRTKMGPVQLMCQNPYNAVMHLGHANGTVLLWLPLMLTPLVKMQVGRGPIRDISVDREGRYMAAVGADKQLRLWDLRKLELLDGYYTPAPALLVEILDSGLVLVGYNSTVTVWKDVFKTRQKLPYMNHVMQRLNIDQMRYVPFEDILGIGHAQGVLLMIVPGAGEANYDAMEINPYESVKQRREQEVRMLLNKLPADTITLDPQSLGKVDARAATVKLGANQEVVEDDENDERFQPRPDLPEDKLKLKRYLEKKKRNVVDQRRLRIERNLEMEKEARRRRIMEQRGVAEEKDVLDSALLRFG